jgi:hypothetical protein
MLYGAAHRMRDSLFKGGSNLMREQLFVTTVSNYEDEIDASLYIWVVKALTQGLCHGMGWISIVYLSSHRSVSSQGIVIIAREAKILSKIKYKARALVLPC